jgi:N-acetylglucosaminyldiphosphoundecaprenol N-acetyl-beta-D-mannosaminyltransferase
VAPLSIAALQHPRTVICGVSFSCFDREGAAAWLLESARSGGGGYVCVTGAHGVVSAQDDAEFRCILNSASMNTLDGQPVAWIARLRGFAVTRVTGRELFWDIVARDSRNQVRHVLLGATPAVTEKMIVRLRERSENVRVEAFSPPFRELSDDDLNEICCRICSSEPTIVWVGMSTPRQERVAARLSKCYRNAPIVAIGAGFDFVAGLKPIAPRIVTLLCMEWLFRLASEPRRLFKRYVHVVPRFLLLIGREMVAGNLIRRHPSASRHA